MARGGAASPAKTVRLCHAVGIASDRTAAVARHGFESWTSAQHQSKSATTLRNRAWGLIVPPARNIWSTRTTTRRRAPWLSKSSPWDAPGLVRMNSFEAKLTNPIDINTIAGGHFRLMPGQYRVTPGQAGRCRATDGSIARWPPSA